MLRIKKLMVENAYSKILVPYDDSIFSKKALETAKMLSKAYDAALYLITVIDISNVSPPGLLRLNETKKTLDQIKDSMWLSAEKILKQKEQECIKEGIKMSILISEGVISDELLKVIMKNNIDLVVIGSQGLSGFSRLKALGSVSRKISEIANCPVMIVH